MCVTGQDQGEGYADVLPASLIEIASWEGKPYGVPVNIHRNNVLWFNKPLMDQVGGTPPAGSGRGRSRGRPWNEAADEERRRWFYTPTDHGGLAVADMTPGQYRRAMRLVASGLSEAGSRRSPR